MYKEILNTNQIELLPMLKQFSKEFYLVGGTAVALYLRHRRSVDFDLFTPGKLALQSILNNISIYGDQSYIVTRRVEEQLNLIVNGVKLTFFSYPYSVEANNTFENIIQIPDLLQLASMKAFALGRRSKWKDYVDLYFILQENYSIQQIVETSNYIYGQLFSEKLFRAQLSYFDDIDYSEEVEYLTTAPSSKKIQSFLTKMAINDL